MASYPNPWMFNGQEFDDINAIGYIGFVYLIEGPTKKYVGKKIFNFRKRLKRKGKRDKLKSVESDWKEYWGSSEELKIDIEKLGVDLFHREIIRLCKTKTEMAYWEAKEQFSRGVMERDDFYNRWISCKIRHKIKIDA